jgi:hypothetical protein
MEVNDGKSGSHKFGSVRREGGSHFEKSPERERCERMEKNSFMERAESASSGSEPTFGTSAVRQKFFSNKTASDRSYCLTPFILLFGESLL